MALKQHRSGTVVIYHKVIQGTAHPTFRKKPPAPQTVNLGIAFRTHDAPIGYFPFYGPRDFNLSGDTSLLEEALSRSPIDLSSAASPHSLLLEQAAGDLEFLGSGGDELVDIQQAVKLDQLRHAFAAASGVLIDGLMTSLGGAAVSSIVNQMIRSKVRQFIVSKGISAVAKKYLKDAARVDADRMLKELPF